MVQLIQITHFIIDNMKEPQKYKMLQLPEETHRLLKEYCAKHGFIMSALITKLVRQEIKRKV